jgi:flagellar biosynthesis protein FliQ
MTPDTVMDIFRQALWIAIIIMGVLIVPGLLVGLMVAMFQAATQINEASLSFIPKLFITFMAMMTAGPWIMKILIGFSKKLINDIPYIIG